MTVNEVRKAPFNTIITPYGKEYLTVIYNQASGSFTAITAILDDQTVMGYDVEINEDDIFKSNLTGDEMYYHSHYITAYDLKNYI